VIKCGAGILDNTPIRELKMQRIYMEDALDMRLGDVLPLIQEGILKETYYFGIPTFKSPNDFWVYQQLLCSLQPDVVVELGNFCGGSALALAHLCDQLGNGRIVGVDIDHRSIAAKVREHPRIRPIEGDACACFTQVREQIGPNDSVLVIEDSSHTYENTLNVLRTYSPLIKPGGYFIVEDSICHHGLDFGPNPGPFEAIECFVKESPEFEIDRGKEQFLITWNPKGYLKRKR
jgi:cephalosporin hydroxylase